MLLLNKLLLGVSYVITYTSLLRIGVYILVGVDWEVITDIKFITLSCNRTEIREHFLITIRL